MFGIFRRKVLITFFVFLYIWKVGAQELKKVGVDPKTVNKEFSMKAFIPDSVLKSLMEDMNKGIKEVDAARKAGVSQESALKEVDATDSVKAIISAIGGKAAEHAKNKDYAKMNKAVDSLRSFCNTLGKHNKHAKKKFEIGVNKVFWNLWYDIKASLRKSDAAGAEATYTVALSLGEKHGIAKWLKRLREKIGPKIEKVKVRVAASARL